MVPTMSRNSLMAEMIPPAPQTDPAIRSLCPPRYLVALWKTRSTPKSRGTLVHRGREGAVDQNLEPPLPGEGDQFLQVDDVKVRVCGRFGEDHARIRLQGLLQLVEIPGAHEAALDPELAEDVAQLHGAAITVLHDHKVLAGTQHRHQGGRDCAHPGGKQQGAVRVVEVGEFPFRRGQGRVAVAAVFVLRLFPGLVGLEFVEGIEDEGRSLGDRVGQGLGSLDPILPAVNGARRSPGERAVGSRSGFPLGRLDRFFWTQTSPISRPGWEPLRSISTPSRRTCS